MTEINNSDSCWSLIEDVSKFSNIIIQPSTEHKLVNNEVDYRYKNVFCKYGLNRKGLYHHKVVMSDHNIFSKMLLNTLVDLHYCVLNSTPQPRIWKDYDKLDINKCDAYDIFQEFYNVTVNNDLYYDTLVGFYGGHFNISCGCLLDLLSYVEYTTTNEEKKLLYRFFGCRPEIFKEGKQESVVNNISALLIDLTHKFDGSNLPKSCRIEKLT